MNAEHQPDQQSVPSDRPIRAVLFDLWGTLIDSGHNADGMERAVTALSEGVDIDRERLAAALDVAFGEVVGRYADVPFYLMNDMFREAMTLAVTAISGDPAPAGVVDRAMDDMWDAWVAGSKPAAGAIETLAALREAGIPTAIVSFADQAEFDLMVDRAGLRGLTDFELCSEAARSCKPHAPIFLQALAALGAEPEDAMYVGDTPTHDVVGGNRLGMRTALVAGPHNDLSTGTAETEPDHHISNLTEVLDIVLGDRAAAERS